MVLMLINAFRGAQVKAAVPVVVMIAICKKYDYK